MTTKADTYEKHAKAFERVSAFVLVRDGEQIGTIALKFPRDGMGRLYAYLHIHGTGMVRGSASGCGYDKRTGAIRAAACALPFPYQSSDAIEDDYVSPRHRAFLRRHSLRALGSRDREQGMGNRPPLDRRPSVPSDLRED